MTPSRTRYFALLSLTATISLSPALQAQKQSSSTRTERATTSATERAETAGRTDIQTREQPVVIERSRVNPTETTGRAASETSTSVALTDAGTEVKGVAFGSRVDANRPTQTERPATTTETPPATPESSSRVDANVATAEPAPDSTTSTTTIATPSTELIPSEPAPGNEQQQQPVAHSSGDVVATDRPAGSHYDTPANSSMLTYPEAQAYLDEQNRVRHQQDRYAAEDAAVAAVERPEPALPLFSASVVEGNRAAERNQQRGLIQELAPAVANQQFPSDWVHTRDRLCGGGNVLPPMCYDSDSLEGYPGTTSVPDDDDDDIPTGFPSDDDETDDPEDLVDDEFLEGAYEYDEEADAADSDSTGAPSVLDDQQDATPPPPPSSADHGGPEPRPCDSRSTGPRGL